MTSIIPNTTLCAIVRDELRNPAGGVKNFVEETVPHFEQAVIVDTGSIDGTWEYLQDAVKQYDNLRVCSIEWNGYGESRNHSLAMADTDWICILDADERIENYEQLKDQFIQYKSHHDGFALFCTNLFPDGTALSEDDYTCAVPVIRRKLFKRCAKIGTSNRPRFFDGYCWEQFVPDTESDTQLIARFIHYLPDREALMLKRKNWYEHAVRQHARFSPLMSTRGFDWKKPHPSRAQFAPSEEEIQSHLAKRPIEPPSKNFFEELWKNFSRLILK